MLALGAYTSTHKFGLRSVSLRTTGWLNVSWYAFNLYTIKGGLKSRVTIMTALALYYQ